MVAAGTPLSSFVVGHQGNYQVVLRPLSALVPTEMVDADSCRRLARDIVRQGCWTHPVPIDAATGLIMDGNHRFQVARELGLSVLPCVPLQYGHADVQVTHWASGQPFAIETIVGLLGSGALLPYKTTRHAFVRPLPTLALPLALLMAG